MITNGLRFRVGVSLMLGLIWTSAAAGDGPLFPGAHYHVGTGPRSVAISDQMPDLAVTNAGGVSVLLNQSAPPGDIDGDVDLSDFSLFAICMGGPGVTTPPPGCDPTDFERADIQDDDGDVDEPDYARFAQALRESR